MIRRILSPTTVQNYASMLIQEAAMWAENCRPTLETVGPKALALSAI